MFKVVDKVTGEKIKSISSLEDANQYVTLRRKRQLYLQMHNVVNNMERSIDQALNNLKIM